MTRNTASFLHNLILLRRFLVRLAIVIVLAGGVPERSALSDDEPAVPPMVICQLPAGDSDATSAHGAGRVPWGPGGRVVLLQPNGQARILSRGLHSACDPSLSFDARRCLFAGKATESSVWNIYEADLETGEVRQITRDGGNCRSPAYQSGYYTIDSPEPWYRITFVSDRAGVMTEDGSGPATDLYCCRPDGTAVERLTYSLSDERDPFLMDDGRILYSCWQQSQIDHGPLGRWRLFAVNLDGTDVSLFADPRGRRIQHMPCVTSSGWVVFVETDETHWDGAGLLAAVTYRRPLRSYRPLTEPQDGLFHSPSPLPDGSLLVACRPLDGTGNHGIYRYDISRRRKELVFDDPRWHDIQPIVVHRRDKPDGRSSVVNLEDSRGQLYCLNLFLTDLPDASWWSQKVIDRVRVVQGVPSTKGGADRPGGVSAMADGRRVVRRILADVAPAADGSLKLDVPANTALELQVIDQRGMVLRSCNWIWARNHEPRGCIGCHEDGEWTPENFVPQAVAQSAVKVGSPGQSARTVTFQRDVLPIIQKRCVGCHGADGAKPRLIGAAYSPSGDSTVHPDYVTLLDGAETHTTAGTYVHPGRARTSPLIWHVLGINTSQPWDGAWNRGEAIRLPEDQHERLTPGEQQTLIEWIDLGALWDAPHFNDKATP